MDAKRWGRIKEIYNRALDLSREECESYLAEACAGDDDLRREVETLLSAHADAGTFLESPAVEVAAREIVADEITSPAPQLIGRELSNYRIISLLGKGGMGEVYLAEDKRLHRKVALKLLPAKFTADADRVRRFEQEARSASALNHPNVIVIFDIGAVDGVHYIATEYVPGQTLRKTMAGETISFGAALSVATQVANALAEAHKAGVLHRDIKPENLMVRPDGVVKVLDFGLAKLLDRRSEFANDAGVSTASGMVMGTVRYMSPEQARGEEVDARTDIFSLGVVLYEMVTGRAPFDGRTSMDVIGAILHVNPTPLSELREETPADLERVVTRALRKDREERYQTVEELLADLTSVGRRPTLSPGSKEPIAARGKPITSLAVLPFVNASANAEANYLSDGITESIINNLSQLPQLLILASSTVFRYKERTGEPLEVGRELRVRTVLVGRILELEGKLIVRTELIDVADGSQLWGAQYDRKSEDLLRVQVEISSEISERLHPHLTGAERKQMAKPHTDDIAAYHLYLKGRYYWNKRTPDDLQKGIDYFWQAIDRDPAYALAYAGIADCYNYMGYAFGRLRPEEAMSKARAAALKALEIDESLAEAHAALAFVKFFFEWDWAGAERYFGKAIALNPGYATVRQVYGAYLATVPRRFDEAIAEANRALELDPLSLPINHIVAQLSLFVGEVDRAIKQYEKTLEIDPRFPMAHNNLGYAFECKGMRERAVEEFLMAKQFQGVDEREVDAFRQAFVTGGWSGYVAKELAAALARWEERNHWHGDAYSVARHYARLGDHDNALQWLESAYELRSSMLIWLEIEPHFEPLRPDPRFQDIARRVGLRP